MPPAAARHTGAVIDLVYRDVNDPDLGRFEGGPTVRALNRAAIDDRIPRRLTECSLARPR